MQKLAIRRSLFATSALTLCALAAAPSAYAADAPLQEVVITGSRIAGVPNAISANPISVTTSEQIDQTKSMAVEDVLARMVGPDANGTTIGTNNGGNGNSTISLRGLNPQRTLVLIDGTRLIPNGGNVDLSIIPLAMVDRIEVLRDGASSIYGADAIAGVVNIITKKKADGLQIDTTFGESQKGDGATYGVAASLGASNERGSVLFGVSWDHRNAIAASDRSWATAPHLNDPNYEGGSAYRSQLDVLQQESGSTVWINGVAYNKHNPVVATLAPNLVFLPHKNVVKMSANGPGWNTLTGSQDRKEISFNGRYDITENVRFVAEGFFSDRTSEQKLRPEPLLGDTISTNVFPGLIIPAWAPGNTTGSSFAAYLTPVQFGPRTYDQDSKTFRIRVGLEGQILGKYKWEGGYVDQENTEVLAIKNSGNWNHFAQLLGEITCLDVPGGCTAGLPNQTANWFGGPNNIFTPAQLAYVKYTRHDNQSANEKYAYFNLNGPLYTLPAGDIKFAAGVEHRDENLSYNPDELTVEGWTANASLPTNGGYNVTSAYVEFYVPVLKDLPFVKSLDLTPSYRHDDYSNFGAADTYKWGLNWAISDDIRFRASAATAFRAPQVGELFGGQSVSDNGASGDPCDSRAAGYNGNANVGKGILTAGSTCSKAVAGGAAVTTFTDTLNEVSNSQIQTLTGGNPALKPEQARDLALGLVLTPTFVPGFTFTVDYYKDKVSNAILTGGLSGSVGLDYILLGCYGAKQDQSLCNTIHRNSAGVIYQIDSLNTNAGYQTVEGIDFEASYDTRRAHLTLPFPGSVKLDLQVSKTIKNFQINPDGSRTDFAGFFNVNNEEIYPTWRALLNIDYKVSNWIFHWDTRYTQSMTDFGAAKVYGDFIPDLYYHSVSATYSFDKLGVLRDARLILGVDNLFDQNPPFLGVDSICKCNTIAGPFDVVGRFFYSRLSTKF